MTTWPIRNEMAVVRMTISDMHLWLKFTGDIWDQYAIQPIQANAWKWFVDGVI